MTRKEHASWRIGYSVVVLLLLGAAGLVETAFEPKTTFARAGSYLLYFLLFSAFIDIGILFESHGRYLHRYRAQHEAMLRKRAAEFGTLTRAPDAPAEEESEGRVG